MARNSFTRGKDDEVYAPPSSPTTPGALSAFIDKGSQFEGKLTFRDTVRIDGRFKGEITSENTLIVGEGGEIEATIRSKTVVVSGSISGDVHASRQIVLHKSSRMDGNVETASLVIEEGAIFNGQVKMLSGDSNSKGATSLKAIEGGANANGDSPPVAARS